MVSDEVKTKPAGPDSISVYSISMEQVIDNEKEEPKTITTNQAVMDGFTSLDFVQGMSLKLEGEWKEEQKTDWEVAEDTVDVNVTNRNIQVNRNKENDDERAS